MTNEEKAIIILKHLDKTINVNWAFEKYYLKAIKSGLKEINEKEKGDAK